MQTENTLALAPVPPPAATTNALTAFASESSFVAAQRMANALCSSTLVPATFQGQANLGSALIALEIAQRLGASPLMVMQNLNVIHGRPAWSSQFIIAALNSCGRFSPIRFDVTGDGDNRSCTAWALDKSSGDRLDGPAVTIAMAKKEGWFGKSGSKWQTMPELMLRYRSAAFFGRLYAPDILMGMQSADEIHDAGGTSQSPSNSVASTLEIVDNTPPPTAPTTKRGKSKKNAAPEEGAAPAANSESEPLKPEGESVDVDPLPPATSEPTKADDNDIFG